ADADTTIGDELYQRLAGERKPGQIVYQGDRLTLFPSDQIIVLSGSARAEQDSTLATADRIAYARNENIIQAFGKATVTRGTNSLASDTLLYDQGSGIVSTYGASTLKEASQEVTGQNLRYSMDRRSGVLGSGRTQYDRWYLEGEDMNKIGERTFVVDEGTFTTDPADPPDYHFGAKNIKLKQEDVIIARPVVLYVSDVPIFYLPWYLEPLGQGRKSGILRPKIGLNTLINASGDERNVQDLGVYWAISEYMDAQAALDWFSESRTIARFDFRYALRYLLRGSAHFERVWNRRIRSTDTLLRVSHDHEFDPSTQLQVDANVSTSRRFFEENSFDPNRLLQRALRSNASFNRRFSWGNLVLGAFSDFRLQEDRTDFKIPQLQLSLNTRPLFPGASRDSGWKQNLQFGASTSFDYDYTTRGDTAGGPDSTLVNAQTSATRATLSGPFDLLGFIKTTPSIDFTETLFNNAVVPDSVVGASQEGFGHLETFGANVSMAANVFRIFQGGPGPISKVRHTFSPAVSFRYQPATRAREDLPFGFPGGGGLEAMGATLNLSNNIDLKVRETRATAKRRQDEEDRIRRAREAGLLKPRAELTQEERMKLDSIALADSLAELREETREDELEEGRRRAEGGRDGTVEAGDASGDEDPFRGEAGRDDDSDASGDEGDDEEEAADAEETGGGDAARGGEEEGGPPERVGTTDATAPVGNEEDQKEFTERTVRLLSVRNRLGYDFVRARDPLLLGFSSLSTDVSSQVSSAVSVSVSATHDLVDSRLIEGDPSGVQEEFFDPFLTGVNTSLRFGGGTSIHGSSTPRQQGRSGEAVTDAEGGQGAFSDGVGLGDEGPGFEAVQSSSLGRWEIDLTHSLTRSRTADSRQSVRFGTSFNPTANWHLSYRTGYNITDGAFQDQSVSLVRELNRWQATLNLSLFPAEPQDRVLVEFAVFLRDIPDLRIPYRTRRE
nr:LPS-assembly protein LptD [Gemmatimonadota bacterium]